MSQEEFERALAEVVEKLDPYLDAQVEARLAVEEETPAGKRANTSSPAIRHGAGWSHAGPGTFGPASGDPFG